LTDITPELLTPIISGEPPAFQHCAYMTRDLGIVQFAQLREPDLSSGFCVDDNARALLVAILAVDPFARLLRTGAAGRRLFPWTPPRPRKRGFDLAGLTPEVTPPGRFYVMDEDLQQPDLTLDTWALTVEGLVRRPVRLTFADLLALPRRDQLVTQECISNPVGGPLMSQALFSGVAVAALWGGALPLGAVGAAARASTAATGRHPRPGNSRGAGPGRRHRHPSAPV